MLRKVVTTSAIKFTIHFSHIDYTSAIGDFKLLDFPSKDFNFCLISSCAP